MIQLKKIDYLNKYLEVLSNIFLCPICNERVNVLNNSIICVNNHTFNFSKKGYFVFYKTSKIKENKIYDTELFRNRRDFINDGFYNVLHENIVEIINSRKDIKKLDMGCGECAHDNLILKKLGLNNRIIGVDLSKSGIELATDYISNNIIPIVTDLNHLPFKDNTFDVILNILSPSNEKEMRRVLKKEGIVIKVTPKKEYLRELRKILELDDYKNEEELDANISKNYDVIEKREINNLYCLEPNQINSLIKMTPLLKGKNLTSDVTINSITIALNIYVLKIKESYG